MASKLIALDGLTTFKNQCDALYIKGLSISGKTITYTKGDGSTGTIITQDTNTTYSAGNGLTLSGTTFTPSLVNTAAASYASSYTAGGSSKFYAVQLDSNKKLGVYVPWTNTTYSAATASTAGLIKVSSVNTSAVTVNSESTTSGRYYPIELNSDGKAIVNVPWTDTNINTTYSAGTGLSLSGTTFNHASNVTAGTISDGGSTRTLAFGGTFKIPSVTYNATGHITGTSTITLTLPANPNTDTKNTAGSTNTSSKIYLIGATSQAANPQTYSHDTAYVGTDGCLYSGGAKVLTAHQDISGKANLSGATFTGAVNLNAGGTIAAGKTLTLAGTSNSGAANIKFGTVNSKNPYFGYALDQTDGTFVWSITGTNYASGLAIGGGSGNLLWKGSVVAVKSDIPTFTYNSSTYTLTIS